MLASVGVDGIPVRLSPGVSGHMHAPQRDFLSRGLWDYRAILALVPLDLSDRLGARTCYHPSDAQRRSFERGSYPV